MFPVLTHLFCIHHKNICRDTYPGIHTYELHIKKISHPFFVHTKECLCFFFLHITMPKIVINRKIGTPIAMPTMAPVERPSASSPTDAGNINITKNQY